MPTIKTPMERKWEDVVIASLEAQGLSVQVDILLQLERLAMAVERLDSNLTEQGQLIVAALESSP